MPRLYRVDQLQQFQAVQILLDPGAIGGPKIIPNCAQISLLWVLDGGVIGHNVLYGRYPGAFAGTVAQANSILVGLTSGAAWTALQPHLAPTTGLSTVSIRDVNEDDQPEIFSTSPGQPGTSTGSPLPNEVAICTTFTSAAAGQSGRGRMYTSGFATTALGTGNIIAAATVTALQNWAGTIKAVLSAAGYVHVIGLPARQAYLGSTGTQHPARAAGSIEVVGYTVKDNHWDSQRRRGLK